MLLELDWVKFLLVFAAKKELLTIWHFPNHLLLFDVEHKKVFFNAVKSFLFGLNVFVFSVANKVANQG